MSISRSDTNAFTEVEARHYLVRLGKGFHVPALKLRKELLTQLIENPDLIRSYDLIKLNEQRESPLELITPIELEQLKLVEVKSSNRNLNPDLRNYYFSVQEREIQLAKMMGNRFVFVFVIYPRNGSAPFHQEMSWTEIESRTRKKRTQFNINF